MKTHLVIRFLSLATILALCAGVRPAAADSSHARIIRLSLVQGEVRFARTAHNDPLADQNTAWESAVANLPIRQGYVLATVNGRAGVEFEDGASAYLDENTVLEFYDLSLSDGAHTTRLVLRQGTASFHVQPGRGDFFSVTGGDFTAQAEGRASFRMDTYDDGSTIGVQSGRVSVLSKTQTSQLEKGQSLTVRAGQESGFRIGSLSAGDDFDKWVAGREERAATATSTGLRYARSPYYSSGFADLYTYGSWIPYAGYGDCWRPFGVGLGWSPFSTGRWVYDPFYGWSWVSYEPWGWLPYHFGGWIFSPMYGWLWVPGGFGWGGWGSWRPSTAVWVRSGGRVGIVPVHPLDAHGRTPVNLAHGVILTSETGDTTATRISTDAGVNWKKLKSPPWWDAVHSNLATATPPTRVSRTMLAGEMRSQGVSVGRDSPIVFDPRERKFINSNAASVSVGEGTERSADVKSSVAEVERRAAPGGRVPSATVRNVPSSAPGAPERASAGERLADRKNVPPPARMSVPPARTFTPPAAPRSEPAAGPRGDWPRGEGPRFDSPRGGSPRSEPMQRSAPAPAPAPRPSAPPPRPH